MINVLIVDDSKFMRDTLAKLLSNTSDVNVVGTERNGVEAMKFLKSRYDVDVIILDFFMPKMNGLETIIKIMEERPTPTIMITIADRSEHADLYFNALQAGAFDIIPKPRGVDSLYVDKIIDKLVDKIRSAAKSKLNLLQSLKAKPSYKPKSSAHTEEQNKTALQAKKSSRVFSKSSFASRNLIIIGASTGGPSKVADLIQGIQYKSNFILVVIQHMPEGFTKSFAERLNKISDYKISEAVNNEPLKNGCGYVARGNYHMIFAKNGNKIEMQTPQDHKLYGVRPSFDYLIPSAAEIFGENCTGIILTGMGKDGSQGIPIIKNKGGITIVQDLDECLIDSMPKEAIKTGAVDHILKIKDIIRFVNTKIIYS